MLSFSFVSLGSIDFVTGTIPEVWLLGIGDCFSKPEKRTQKIDDPISGLKISSKMISKIINGQTV